MPVITFSGWEKALTNDDDPAFRIGHDLGEKVIQAEYDAYNDIQRVNAEGKMMRIVDDYQRGSDRLVIRMDNEQIAIGEWKPGMVIAIAGPLIGQEEKGHVAVSRVEPVPGHEDLISDIICRRVDEAEAERLAKVMVDAEIARRAETHALLEKRVQKRARQLSRQKARS